MKTTLELPDELLAELKVRAARDGRDVQEVAAGLLATALRGAAAAVEAATEPVPKHLPLIKARPAEPDRATSLTAQQMCDFVKDVDLQLEVERFERALEHQHVDRARP